MLPLATASNFQKNSILWSKDHCTPLFKASIVFLLNEGDNKITLSNVVNDKIFKYMHWSDNFKLRYPSIIGNKNLVFNLTMQRLDEILGNLNLKTNKLTNARHFVLKNHVSFKAEDVTIKTGYIINSSKEYVRITRCNDVFNEWSAIKRMVSAKVKHICPFVGEVEEMVVDCNWVDSRVSI